MNDSQYKKLLLRMMRKVPDSYRGYVDTSALDKAHARGEVQRDLNYERLGAMRDSNNRNIDLANRRLDVGTTQFNRRYDVAEDNFEAEKSNINIANLLGGAGMGVKYLEGRNERKANKILADLLEKRTAFWNSMN